ncbi:MAG: DoxX family protein [Bacteroidota bacterium]
MKKLTTIGRILYAIPFIIFGINHFLFVNFYIGNISSFIPLGPYTIILTGVFLIMAGLSILFNKYIQLSTILLAILLFIFIITIHIPGLFDPQQWQVALIELLKDTSLMGGSLLIAGIVREDKQKEK